jgi:hypothetical protein
VRIRWILRLVYQCEKVSWYQALGAHKNVRRGIILLSGQPVTISGYIEKPKVSRCVALAQEREFRLT